MNLEDDPLDPPKRLAITYFKGDAKALLEALLKFDVRLGQIVLRGSEVVIGQMRMAWWRDVIASDLDAWPKGEPSIAELAVIAEKLGKGSLESALAAIIDSWDILLANEVWSRDILIEHARLRSDGIFLHMAKVWGQTSIAPVFDHGKIWALCELGYRSDTDIKSAIGSVSKAARLPREARGLSILSMAARQQYYGGGGFSGVRLLWHGLTGM
ncbi:MAG: hypothetical protein V3V15_07380 [Sphingorhabdus sp.]